MSSTSEKIKHGYSTIRAVLDDLRGRTVVIGVVAWDAEAHWYRIRTLGQRERIPGVNSELRNFSQISVEQLNSWAEKGTVPYAKGDFQPWDSSFWIAASRVMTTAIRLDAPRSMDPLKEPETEVDLLFEALAQPLLSPDSKQKRIDGVITNALGDATKLLRRSVDLPAFHGASETVMRANVGINGSVVVEGVNLASANARKDADALVSRLLRIMEASAAGQVRVVIGYVASPGGLNGETHMRDWIMAKVTDKVFDVVAESHRFKSAAIDELREAGLSFERS